MAILFLDCYDSFTYNLVNLIKHTLPGQEIIVVHNDQINKAQLQDFIGKVQAVIVGPGPGSPSDPNDAGIIDELWANAHDVPVLGICFGLQSLVYAHKGKLDRLKEPQHGQYGFIKHNNDQIFTNIPQDYKVIRYHSLHAIPQGDEIKVLATCTTDDCVMAVKHTNFPYYGVQFHPESILSEYGHQLVANFWEIAQLHNKSRDILPLTSVNSKEGLHVNALMPRNMPEQGPAVKQLEDKHTPIEVCESLRRNGKKFVLLDSRAFPGQWSIVGLIEENTTFIRNKGDSTFIGPIGYQKEYKGDSWAHIVNWMTPKIVKGDYNVPFIGGLVGYVTYEKACGLESPSNSDLSFVFIENCILISQDGTTCTVGDVGKVITSPAVITSMPQFTTSTPNQEDYETKIEKCKEYLYSGDSYELCLTGQTVVDFDTPVDPWELYKRIGTKNPAPYAIFMDFDDILVGSSPERFMSWSSDGKCQFRPIKGTVKKASGVDFAAASEILGSKKEQGENLMIVDLIRHDLGQIIDNVSCPQVMRVEEYKTVFQLVSVIEGDLSTQSEYSGVDVLIHSLPPGSMTGAPKKRSVELLRDIEDGPRGLYSGVAGYWSIHDAGDWSVIIRSAFQYKGDTKWRLGAGGAITILSDNGEEFQEMKTKLHSALQAFS